MSILPLSFLSASMRRRTAVGLAAAALSASAWLPAQAQQDTITFGAALSLTGKMSTEGRLCQEGYDIYVEEINKRGGIKVGGKSYKVAIKYYDDQSDANTSVKLYEKLINEDGIKLLLGPYSSGITFATSAVTEKYQLPMVAAHAAATTVYSRGFKYLFATLTPVDQYTSNFIKMAAAATPRGAARGADLRELAVPAGQLRRRRQAGQGGRTRGRLQGSLPDRHQGLLGHDRGDEGEEPRRPDRRRLHRRHGWCWRARPPSRRCR